jgi:hypothetical protein
MIGPFWAVACASPEGTWVFDEVTEVLASQPDTWGENFVDGVHAYDLDAYLTPYYDDTGYSFDYTVDLGASEGRIVIHHGDATVFFFKRAEGRPRRGHLARALRERLRIQPDHEGRRVLFQPVPSRRAVRGSDARVRRERATSHRNRRLPCDRWVSGA